MVRFRAGFSRVLDQAEPSCAPYHYKLDAGACADKTLANTNVYISVGFEQGFD